MRIFMLTCHPGIRGPFPKILPLLASTLRQRGHIVVTEPWGRHHDSETFVTKVFGRLMDLGRILKSLIRSPSDLFLIHTASEWANYSRDIPALIFARLLGCKTVIQFHGSTPELALGAGNASFKLGSRMMFWLSDAVLLLSTDEKRKWEKFHPKARCRIVLNPFVASSDTEGQFAGRKPSQSEEVRLLFVGRLIAEKGVFDLIEGAALLKGHTPFSLKIAGVGPLENEVRDRIAELGLSEIVTLSGYLEGERLLQAYRDADIFVFPSWSEGFPTVITEAMDAGLPIVTTQLRGAMDHLRDGEHVLFVPARAPKELAASIRRVIDDRELRERMGRENRRKLKDFSPEAVGKHYEAVLQDILETNEFAPVQIETPKQSFPANR